MGLDDADQLLVELIFFGLDHGIESVRASGGPLIPFAVVENGSGRTLHRFAAERLEEALEQAYAFVRSREGEFARAVVVYDGYATLEGRRSDAIFAHGRSVAPEQTHLLAQRYRPAGFLRPFKTIGNAAYLGDGDAELWSGE